METSALGILLICVYTLPVIATIAYGIRTEIKTKKQIKS